MITELIGAEKSYLIEIGKNKIDVPRALETNRLYSEKLFEFYHTLTDPEERAEIEYEIDYMIDQARAIKDFFQLKQTGGTA